LPPLGAAAWAAARGGRHSRRAGQIPIMATIFMTPLQPFVELTQVPKPLEAARSRSKPLAA